jgi:hypothetical protein
VPAQNPSSAERLVRMSLLLVALFCALETRAQGPAPETAPPLFPGGALISYNSVFTTRGAMPGTSSGIPATAFPSFSHEGDFNFTWGFYRNFDLTVLVPIVTNHFQNTATPTVGGTGLGDAMVLVKYRFYSRDSQRGTTQASVTVGPKIPTGLTDLNAVNGKTITCRPATRLRLDRLVSRSELDLHRALRPETSRSR